MKPVATETAASTVDLIVEQLWSIIYAGRPVEDKPENLLKILAKYMMKIPNALTDQTNVMPAFVTLFQNYKEKLLPQLECENLNAEEKKELAQMNHFFCKMHLLSNGGMH